MPNVREMVAGLKILEKYGPEEWVAAEHDIIFSGPGKDDVSPEDQEELEKLGWHFDPQYDCWARFC